MEAKPEEAFFKQLIDQKEKIGLRYQAVFQLKNLNTDESIKKLVDSYPSLNDSVLLSHEALYALGQVDEAKLPIVKDFLIDIVNNEKENSLSRHEAAEALANYFLPELEDLYKKHLNSSCNELKWTCQIAIEKVRQSFLKQTYGKLYFNTKEPAAPFSKEEFESFLKERQFEDFYKVKRYLGLLLRQDISLFCKYRIMYLMRNENSEEGRKTLCQLLSRQFFKTQTSLLKHQICFILGQIGCEKHQNLVRECIENEDQEPIVRHEALAAVASQSKDAQYLDKFINHPNGLIRQSAIVAQFSIHYWND